MNQAEFRTVLDWWMCSDPFPEGVNKQVIDDWLNREAKERGYTDLVGAYHKAPTIVSNKDAYIGDGVYARFNGQEIWLRAPSDGGDRYICLNSGMLEQIQKIVIDYDREE